MRQTSHPNLPRLGWISSRSRQPGDWEIYGALKYSSVVISSLSRDRADTTALGNDCETFDRKGKRPPKGYIAMYFIDVRGFPAQVPMLAFI
jgi:hypothetical protein